MLNFKKMEHHEILATACELEETQTVIITDAELEEQGYDSFEDWCDGDGLSDPRLEWARRVEAEFEKRYKVDADDAYGEDDNGDNLRMALYDESHYYISYKHESEN